MIETLLPKARTKECKEFMARPREVTESEYKQARNFKLVELFAQDDRPRPGWLKVYSERHNANRISEKH